MSDVEQIESAILRLPLPEFRRLSDWILELDQRRWDEQMERDIAASRLDDLVPLVVEARSDFIAEQCQPMTAAELVREARS